MKLNKAMNKIGIDLDLTVFIQNVLNNIVQPIILIEPFHIKNYSSNTYFNLNEYIIDLYSMCTEVSRELVSNSCCGNTEGYFIISEDQSEIVQNDFILEIYGIGNITDLILELVTDVAGGNCRRINKNCKCKKMDLQSDILQIEAAIFQFGGSNTIDNIDLYTNLTPSTNVAVTSTDCLEMTLQFKDPFTGLNVGNSTTYSTNVGTNFSAADVLDWETSFGIFGGVQGWTGSDFSLTGWSKNTPQGAFLLPNTLLGNDITFTFQIKKDCGSTIVSNISTPILAKVESIAITDNNTLNGQTLAQTVYPTYPIGGIEYFADPTLAVKKINLVADPNVTVGTIYLAFFALNSNFVHNDGGYILESLDYNYNGLNVIVNTPIAGGIDFRNAIANAIGVAVGGTSFGTTPIIETEYPVIQLTNNTDGEVRCIAVNGLTPMQVPKRLYIKRPANPDVEIRIVFNLFINR